MIVVRLCKCKTPCALSSTNNKNERKIHFGKLVRFHDSDKYFTSVSIMVLEQSTAFNWNTCRAIIAVTGFLSIRSWLMDNLCLCTEHRANKEHIVTHALVVSVFFALSSLVLCVFDRKFMLFIEYFSSMFAKHYRNHCIHCDWLDICRCY